MREFVVALIIFLTGCASFVKCASPWPAIYGGSARRNRALTSGCSTNGSLSWSVAAESYDYVGRPCLGCMGGRQSPVFGMDGTIYLPTTGANAPMLGSLYAFDASGAIKWRYNNASNGDFSAPAVGPDGTLYSIEFAYFYDAEDSRGEQLVAISSNGVHLWSHPITCYAGTRSTPAVDDKAGIIYVGAVNLLYAFTLQGKLQWTFVADSDLDFSPAIGSDGTIYGHRGAVFTRSCLMAPWCGAITLRAEHCSSHPCQTMGVVSTSKPLWLDSPRSTHLTSAGVYDGPRRLALETSVCQCPPLVSAQRQTCSGRVWWVYAITAPQ
jgi:hypothetical protein